MSTWSPEDGKADIEMTINGVEGEYRIYYNHTYHKGWTAPHSGTSRATEPDEPVEHYFEDLQMENIIGEMISLSSSEEELAIGVLIERAEEL